MRSWKECFLRSYLSLNTHHLVVPLLYSHVLILASISWLEHDASSSFKSFSASELAMAFIVQKLVL